jgi:mRNA interferase RelE/StbE
VTYNIEFVRRAERQLRSLSQDIQRRLDAAIQGLKETPRPPGCKKLTGVADLWRVRVGEYRIVYQIRERELLLLVVKVGHRREVYR